MFSWGNWITEVVIAVFFISGFVVFYNQRPLMAETHPHFKLTRHVTTTLFVFLMAGFSLFAAYIRPINSMFFYV